MVAGKKGFADPSKGGYVYPYPVYYRSPGGGGGATPTLFGRSRSGSMGLTTVIRDYGTEILNAIRENDVQKLRFIVEKTLRSDSKIAKLCVTDIRHKPTKKFACPLILAARQEDSRIMKYMMDKGTDPNFVHHTIFSSKRREIVTALHIAVDLGFYDVAEVLLNANADSNLYDHSHETPLHIAVKKADHAMMKMLLSKGADPTIPDNKKNGALHIATLYGHLQMVRTLLKYDADIYQRGQWDAIPLHIAAKEGHIHLIQLFCSRDIGNINIKIPCYLDRREKAPIHLAAENGHTESILVLLDQFDADVNLKDSDGNTALHCVVLHPYDIHRMRDKEYFTESARVLIKFRVTINERNVFGDTALHFAAMNHYQRIVELLLEMGANPFLENEDGLKPVDTVPDSDPVTKQILKMAMARGPPPKSMSMDLSLTPKSGRRMMEGNSMLGSKSNMSFKTTSSMSSVFVDDVRGQRGHKHRGQRSDDRESRRSRSRDDLEEDSMQLENGVQEDGTNVYQKIENEIPVYTKVDKKRQKVMVQKGQRHSGSNLGYDQREWETISITTMDDESSLSTHPSVIMQDTGTMAIQPEVRMRSRKLQTTGVETAEIGIQQEENLSKKNKKIKHRKASSEQEDFGLDTPIPEVQPVPTRRPARTGEIIYENLPEPVGGKAPPLPPRKSRTTPSASQETLDDIAGEYQDEDGVQVHTIPGKPGTIEVQYKGGPITISVDTPKEYYEEEGEEEESEEEERGPRSPKSKHKQYPVVSPRSQRKHPTSPQTKRKQSSSSQAKNRQPASPKTKKRNSSKYEQDDDMEIDEQEAYGKKVSQKPLKQKKLAQKQKRPSSDYDYEQSIEDQKEEYFNEYYQKKPRNKRDKINTNQPAYDPDTTDPTDLTYDIMSEISMVSSDSHSELVQKMIQEKIAEVTTDKKGRPLKGHQKGDQQWNMETQEIEEDDDDDDEDEANIIDSDEWSDVEEMEFSPEHSPTRRMDRYTQWEEDDDEVQYKAPRKTPTKTPRKTAPKDKTSTQVKDDGVKTEELPLKPPTQPSPAKQPPPLPDQPPPVGRSPRSKKPDENRTKPEPQSDQSPVRSWPKVQIPYKQPATPMQSTRVVDSFSHDEEMSVSPDNSPNSSPHVMSFKEKLAWAESTAKGTPRVRTESGGSAKDTPTKSKPPESVVSAPEAGKWQVKPDKKSTVVENLEDRPPVSETSEDRSRYSDGDDEQEDDSSAVSDLPKHLPQSGIYYSLTTQIDLESESGSSAVGVISQPRGKKSSQNNQDTSLTVEELETYEGSPFAKRKQPPKNKPEISAEINNLESYEGSPFPQRKMQTNKDYEKEQGSEISNKPQVPTVEIKEYDTSGVIQYNAEPFSLRQRSSSCGDEESHKRGVSPVSLKDIQRMPRLAGTKTPDSVLSEGRGLGLRVSAEVPKAYTHQEKPSARRAWMMANPARMESSSDASDSEMRGSRGSLSELGWPPKDRGRLWSEGAAKPVHSKSPIDPKALSPAPDSHGSGESSEESKSKKILGGYAKPYKSFGKIEVKTDLIEEAMLNSSIPEDPEHMSDLEPWEGPESKELDEPSSFPPPADINIIRHSPPTEQAHLVKPHPIKAKELGSAQENDLHLQEFDSEPGAKRGPLSRPETINISSLSPEESNSNQAPISPSQLSPRSDSSDSQRRKARKTVSVKEERTNAQGDVVETITTTVIKTQIPQVEQIQPEIIASTEDLSFGDSTFDDDLDDLVAQNALLKASHLLPPPPSDLMPTDDSQEILDTECIEQKDQDAEPSTKVKSKKVRKSKTKKSTENLAEGVPGDQEGSVKGKIKKKKKKKVRDGQQEDKENIPKEITLEESVQIETEKIDIEQYEQEPGFIKPKKVQGVPTFLVGGVQGIPLKPSEVSKQQKDDGSLGVSEREPQQQLGDEQNEDPDVDLMEYEAEPGSRFSRPRTRIPQKQTEVKSESPDQVTGEQPEQLSPEPETIDQSMTDMEVAEITDAAEARRRAREAARAQREWHKKQKQQEEQKRSSMEHLGLTPEQLKMQALQEQAIVAGQPHIHKRKTSSRSREHSAEDPRRSRPRQHSADNDRARSRDRSSDDPSKSKRRQLSSSPGRRKVSPSPTRDRVTPSPNSYTIVVEGDAQITTSKGKLMDVPSQEAVDEQNEGGLLSFGSKRGKKKKTKKSTDNLVEAVEGDTGQEKKKKKKKKLGSQDDLSVKEVGSHDDIREKKKKKKKKREGSEADPAAEGKDGSQEDLPGASVPAAAISDVWKEAMEGAPLASSEAVFGVETQPTDQSSKPVRKTKKIRKKSSRSGSIDQDHGETEVQMDTEQVSSEVMIKRAKVPKIPKSSYETNFDDDVENDQENKVPMIHLSESQKTAMLASRESKKQQQIQAQLAREQDQSDQSEDDMMELSEPPRPGRQEPPTRPKHALQLQTNDPQDIAYIDTDEQLSDDMVHHAKVPKGISDRKPSFETNLDDSGSDYDQEMGQIPVMAISDSQKAAMATIREAKKQQKAQLMKSKEKPKGNHEPSEELYQNDEFELDELRGSPGGGRMLTGQGKFELDDLQGSPKSGKPRPKHAVQLQQTTPGRDYDEDPLPGGLSKRAPVPRMGQKASYEMELDDSSDDNEQGQVPVIRMTEAQRQQLAIQREEKRRQKERAREIHQREIHQQEIHQQEIHQQEQRGGSTPDDNEFEELQGPPRPGGIQVQPTRPKHAMKLSQSEARPESEDDSSSDHMHLVKRIAPPVQPTGEYDASSDDDSDQETGVNPPGLVIGMNETQKDALMRAREEKRRQKSLAKMSEQQKNLEIEYEQDTRRDEQEFDELQGPPRPGGIHVQPMRPKHAVHLSQSEQPLSSSSSESSLSGDLVKRVKAPVQPTGGKDTFEANSDDSDESGTCPPVLGLTETQRLELERKRQIKKQQKANQKEPKHATPSKENQMYDELQQSPGRPPPVPNQPPPPVIQHDLDLSNISPTRPQYAMDLSHPQDDFQLDPDEPMPQGMVKRMQVPNMPRRRSFETNLDDLEAEEDSGHVPTIEISDNQRAAMASIREAKRLQKEQAQKMKQRQQELEEGTSSSSEEEMELPSRPEPPNIPRKPQHAINLNQPQGGVDSDEDEPLPGDLVHRAVIPNIQKKHQRSFETNLDDYTPDSDDIPVMDIKSGKPTGRSNKPPVSVKPGKQMHETNLDDDESFKNAAFAAFRKMQDGNKPPVAKKPQTEGRDSPQNAETGAFSRKQTGRVSLGRQKGKKRDVPPGGKEIFIDGPELMGEDALPPDAGNLDDQLRHDLAQVKGEMNGRKPMMSELWGDRKDQENEMQMMLDMDPSELEPSFTGEEPFPRQGFGSRGVKPQRGRLPPPPTASPQHDALPSQDPAAMPTGSDPHTTPQGAAPGSMKAAPGPYRPPPSPLKSDKRPPRAPSQGESQLTPHRGQRPDYYPRTPQDGGRSPRDPRMSPHGPNKSPQDHRHSLQDPRQSPQGPGRARSASEGRPPEGRPRSASDSRPWPPRQQAIKRRTRRAFPNEDGSYNNDFQSDSETMKKPRHGKSISFYDYRSDTEVNRRDRAPKMRPSQSLEEVAWQQLRKDMEHQPKAQAHRVIKKKSSDSQINYTRGIYRPTPVYWRGSQRSIANTSRYDDSELISQLWNERNRSMGESEGEAADMEDISYDVNMQDESPGDSRFGSDDRLLGRTGSFYTASMPDEDARFHSASMTGDTPPPLPYSQPPFGSQDHYFPAAFHTVGPAKKVTIIDKNKKKRMKEQKDLPPRVINPGPVDFEKYGTTAKLWMEHSEKTDMSKSKTMYLSMLGEGNKPPPQITDNMPRDKQDAGGMPAQWVIARGRSLRLQKAAYDERIRQQGHSGVESDMEHDPNDPGKQMLLFFKIGENWKDLSWVLFDGLQSDGETLRMLKEIQHRHPDKLNDQVHDMMHRWWKKKGASATIEELQKGLEFLKMAYVEEEYVNQQGIFSAGETEPEVDISTASEDDATVNRLIHNYKHRSRNASFEGPQDNLPPDNNNTVNTGQLLRKLEEATVDHVPAKINRSSLTRSARSGSMRGQDDSHGESDYEGMGGDGTHKHSFVIVQPQLKSSDYKHETTM